ncbi:MAG: hypothetical protein CEE38_15610 [Planctomycetes bacterium B3_Pla]|nr:MAG: hypothetical protein CEE38_15610 [Planctomycetes bacterium B3_Pla]
MSKKLIYLISFVLLPGLVGVAAGTEGLKGEYYHATISAHEWQDLVLTRIDPDVNFDWGDQSPEQGIVNSDNFTVRWTGMIEAPNSETYTFHTEANDGVRLWINSELVIDTWTWNKKWQVTQPPIEIGSGNITLTAGQQYEIILEYYERGGSAMCKLSWSTPTLPQEIIPNRYLSVERPNARNPEPADDDILRVALVTLLWAPGDYAVSHDVYVGENFDEVDAGAADTFRGNQVSTSFSIGFAGVPYPGGLVPGTTYYWRIDEVNDLHPNSPWKGLVRSFSIAPRTAYNPNPADGGDSVNPNVELGWESGFGAMLHYVYFGDNFDDVNNAAGGLPQGTTTYTPGLLKLAKTYYWRVDEFDGLARHKGDVWSFTTEGAVGSPEPSNGAVDVKQTPILSWSPGIYAASHQVYLGADQEAVKNANTGSPEYKGTKNLGSESHDPGKLQLETTYYWRIDQVNDVNPDSPWTGHIWSFTTGNFLTVDDFEDYNDYPPDEIWNTWIDGFGTTTNGSTVGYANPDFPAGEHFVETNIVHGGSQSMPYFYDNNLKTSEATMTLVSVRDWTEEGVTKLSLRFIGDAANSAERMFVALNGTAVVYHDDASATQITGWNEWVIDLQEFANQGVVLTNVNTITIGFGTKNSPTAGGTGTIYFDDIRLIR